MNFWSVETVSIAGSKPTMLPAPFLAARATRVRRGGSVRRASWRGAAPARSRHGRSTRTTVSNQCGRAMFSSTVRIIGSTSIVVFSNKHHGEFVAADAADHRFRRHCFAQAVGDRDDQFVAAEDAEMRGDVFHAVEFDQARKSWSRARHVRPATDRAVRASWRGWADRSACPRRRRARACSSLEPRSRPARRNCASEKPAKPIKANASAGNVRHQPVHRSAHRPGPVPGEETGDAALRRRAPAASRGRLANGSVSNFRPCRRALCSTMRMKRGSISRALPEHSAEFADGVAQRGALLRPLALVALLRQAIADAGADQSRANGEQRKQDDQARSRERAARARARDLGRARACLCAAAKIALAKVSTARPGANRALFVTASPRTRYSPAIHCGPQAIRDKESALMLGQQRR